MKVFSKNFQHSVSNLLQGDEQEFKLFDIDKESIEGGYKRQGAAMFLQL